MWGGQGLKEERNPVERVLSGDTAAFEEIIRANKERVLKVVSNMVPSDAVEEAAQETFVRAYGALHSFRGKGAFEHWLVRIAVNTCYDYWRRERKRKVVPVSDVELHALESRMLDERLSEDAAVDAAKELLDAALQHLSPADRLVFSLLYLEGLSMKEVGEQMNWSVAQVKIRSFRARHRLKDVLKKSSGQQKNGRA